MEGLIELVAASFARHGIECPAGDLQLAQTKSVQPKQAQAMRPPEPNLTTALPEHNYRKRSQPDQTEICP
jgi:hypothetical protein